MESGKVVGGGVKTPQSFDKLGTAPLDEGEQFFLLPAQGGRGFFNLP